jgi:transcriptional regulator with XRE-family HTH domain
MAGNIGRRLQEARRSKEISLQQVSEETRIHKDYLEALEKEEYDVFPAKIYVVSFLRSYARYLGLDAESLVHIYKREHSGQKDRMKLNPKFPIVVTQVAVEKSLPRKGIALFRFTRRFPRRGVIPFILAVGLIVGAGLSVILFLQSSSKQLFSQLEVKKNIPTFSTNIPGDISIVAEVKDKTWLRVVGDGVNSFEGILFPGENRKWVAKNEMNVRIGNVHGVKLYVNGEEVDIISGNLGRVNELIFTRSEEKGLINIEQRRPLQVEKMATGESKLKEEEK